MNDYTVITSEYESKNSHNDSFHPQPSNNSHGAPVNNSETIQKKPLLTCIRCLGLKVTGKKKTVTMTPPLFFIMKMDTITMMMWNFKLHNT